MKRHIFTIIFIISLSFSGYSQDWLIPSKYVGFSTGVQHWGSGDLIIPIQGIEFRKDLNEFVGVLGKLSNGFIPSHYFGILHSETGKVEKFGATIDMINQFDVGTYINLKPFRNFGFGVDFGAAFSHYIEFTRFGSQFPPEDRGNRVRNNYSFGGYVAPEIHISWNRFKRTLILQPFLKVYIDEEIGYGLRGVWMLRN